MKEVKKSGYGTAAFVLGIIGFVFAFIPLANYIAYILGILAIVFAIVSLAQHSSKAHSIVGMILAIFAIIITVISNVLIYNLLNYIGQEFTDYINENYSYLEDEDIQANMTLQKYGQITIGMTYDEVVRIAGSDGILIEESHYNDLNTKVYKWLSNNRISNATITFVNNAVVVKTEFLLDIA